MKHFGEACTLDATPLSRGMTFEVCIKLHKYLCHDPTSEFCICKDKESLDDVGSINLKATKSTNPEVVVVPPPKNVVLSLPTPSSFDESSEEESHKKPPAVESLLWTRLS